MSNYNISEYLVPTDVAKWMHKHGFDARTSHFYNEYDELFISTNKEGFESPSMIGNIAAATFDQLFDWAQDKWQLSLSFPEKSSNGNWYYNEKPYLTKRDANIAVCKAIINYIDKK